MSFTPRLSSTTFVPVRSPASATTAPLSQPATVTIHFTYTARPDSDPAKLEPQVWTNLVSSLSEQDDTTGNGWHAVPLIASSDPALRGLFVASVPVALEGLTRDGRRSREFEFTYRFTHFGDGQREGDEGIEWVGSEGGNGKIVFVDVPTLDSDSSGEGETTEESRDGIEVKVARYETRDGEERTLYDLTNEVESWLGSTQRIQIEGLTLEQSSRTWFTPRIIPAGPNPLSHLSHSFVSQLVLLRAPPSLECPFERLFVAFPFSSTRFNASLIGQQDRDGLFLRCDKDQGRHDTGDDNDESESDSTRDQSGVVIVRSSPSRPGPRANGSSVNFERLVSRAVKAARLALSPLDAQAKSSEKTGWEKSRRTGPLEDLTLCTWNALGPDYTVSSLLTWLDDILSPSNTTRELSESFKRGGVMLDDGWQDTAIFEGSDRQELRGLKGFGTRDGWFDLSKDEKMEGTELARAVKKIKEKGIERVGVWITITGYWNCLHPSFSDPTPIKLTRATFSSREHDNFHFTSIVPTLDSLELFFSTYFSRMKHDAGIDFIKIDNQALVDSIVSLEDSTAPGLYRAKLLSVVQRESARVFGPENVVHCMAHSTRIWSGPLALSSSSSSSSSDEVRAQPRSKKAALRNSDDYFPNEPDSHRWHVYINAVNLVLTRQFHDALDPDLDMGQERHEFGAFHLALKGFSTSRVWATDSSDAEPNAGEGETSGRRRLGDPDRGWKGLLATSLDGTRVVQARGGQGGSIVANQVLSRGITSRDGGGRQGGEALKVGLNGARAKGGTIGLWNCQEGGSVEVRLSARDVSDVVHQQDRSTSDEDLVVFVDSPFGPSPSSPSSTRPPIVTTITRDELDDAGVSPLSLPIVVTELPPRAVSIARFAELFSLVNERDERVRVACLGLSDKFVGIEAIKSVRSVTSAAEERLDPIRSRKEDETKEDTPALRTSATSSTRSSAIDFPAPPSGTFLSSYFANFFSRVDRPATISPASPSPASKSSPIKSFLDSLWRRPVTTLLSEVRGILTFGFAVIAWSFRNRRRGLGQSQTLRPSSAKLASLEDAGERRGQNLAVKEKATIEREEHFATGQLSTAVTAAAAATTSKQNCLRVELEFISSQLLFFYRRSRTTRRGNVATWSELLKFNLDGLAIDEKWISTIGNDNDDDDDNLLDLVQVDVEGFWEANGRRKKLGAKVWVVEVIAV